MHNFLDDPVKHSNTACLAVLAFFYLLLLAFPAPVLASSQQELNYMHKRQQMVQLIEDDVSRTSVYLDKETLDPKVMQAIETVPRHRFVPESRRDDAYQNNPLPIGHGQTISQPYIVAIMTDLLKLSPQDKVLEIGTGSGYQAAILAQLVDHVYSIEIIEPLGLRATEVFKQLEYHNITTKIGDGYYGWEEHAPFDSIIVTAAASHIPHPLIQQLKPGGHMMIPVGSNFLTQQLLLLSKTEDGQIKTRQILPVRFVPLTGEH